MTTCLNVAIVDSMFKIMRIWKDSRARVRKEERTWMWFCSLVIKPAYLWLWVIRLWSASGLTLYFPFQLTDEHNIHDICMETFSDPVTRQYVNTGTCSACRPARVLSVSLIRPIKLSLYESSIRSSVPTSYGSLALISFILYQREALCQIPSTCTPYPWVFIMPMSLGGAGGWPVVCSRAAVEYAVFWGVSQCVCERGRGGGCSTAYSTSYHMGRLQSRKGGWQAAILSLHCRWYAENAVLLGCWEAEL